MGGAMVVRLSKHHDVVVHDCSEAAMCRASDQGAEVAGTLPDLVVQLSPPRVVWLMLPAGAPTESTIQELSRCLERDDVIVDGGNSHYRDSMRRASDLARSGIDFLDVGTSGGVEGGARGYSLMVGGAQSVVGRIAPLLDALASDSNNGWGRVGPNGAGHFAKMVHNGVEYGLIQAYAQGLSALSNKGEFCFDLAQVADIWCHGAMARSALLDLIRQALTNNPELGPLAPYVADEGADRWTVEDALDQLAQRGFDRNQFA